MTHGSLRLVHLRLTVQPETELVLPAENKGSTLRGGFGAAFRKLVCVDTRWECASCSLRFTCPYTAVFSPFLPPDAERLTRSRDIPRPFVFKPPRTDRTRFGRDDALLFDLVLIGSAIDYLPYFIVSFRELGASGFGLNRARIQLSRVEALAGDGTAALVYASERNLVHPPAARALDLLTAGDGDTEGATELALDFLTPTTLRIGSDIDRPGTIVRHPDFHHVLKRLRDRLNALMTFHGPGPLELDFRALGAAAEAVVTVDDRTRWVSRSRYSARRGVSHDLSGFAGRVTYRGHLAQFLPLLWAGELVHVGKNAVFGNGWYAVERGERPGGSAAGT